MTTTKPTPAPVAAPPAARRAKRHPLLARMASYNRLAAKADKAGSHALAQNYRRIALLSHESYLAGVKAKKRDEYAKARAAAGAKPQTARLVKVVCSCEAPRILRVSRTALAAGPITCGVCASPFVAADEAP